MSEPSSAVNGSSLPMRAERGELVDVAPVLDGELVDYGPNVRRTTLWQRFTAWWKRSPLVPVAFKSRRLAVQAGKELVARMLRAPFRFVGGVARGVVVAARWWRSWVRVSDYREAAEQSEKLADKFTDIRALTLFRWKVTAAIFGATAVTVAVLDLVYGNRALWITGAVLSVGLAVLGRRKDGSPGRKPVLAGPRTLTWTMDP